MFQDFEVLKQGAEARILRGRYLGLDCIVKQRFVKKYRHQDLDSRLNKDRLKAEARALIRCKALGVRTPTLYLVDQQSMAICMEFLEESKTVRDFITQNQNHDQLNVLACELGSILGRLHANNVIHGDLTTSNVLVEDGQDPRKLVLIDFGLGFNEGSAEDKAVDLYVLERAMLSTHPGSEAIFEVVLDSYAKTLKAESKNEKEVLRKYEEVRRRGRKRTMVG